ncbi:MAG: serine/threonine protein kinase, partial [Planctomycetales bacterium]|nr:serine/threonine protein kinase [Planctomycetales bacterium]
MLKARQRLGKYVIERRLGEGGFATVYQAKDTIEGIRVALKVPHAHLMSESSLELFRHEVRVAAQLEHPNILPLKYADFIDGKFVIVTALGMETLEHRLQRRLSVDKGISFAEQMLAAVGYAHEQRIIHCDIKPDNFVLFSGNRLRLTDFGIARFAQHTLQGSGAGTVGYIAPEQAMGKPSFRSDVFSLGLVLYRTFTGYLPEWPFDWPPPGYLRLRQRLDPDFIDLIRKSLHINARQ